jgi:hypothetical protein
MMQKSSMSMSEQKVFKNGDLVVVSDATINYNATHVGEVGQVGDSWMHSLRDIEVVRVVFEDSDPLDNSTMPTYWAHDLSLAKFTDLDPYNREEFREYV